MLTINKLCMGSPIDFAAEELKKYLRMMMPEAGDIRIAFDPSSKGGFRLGLMSDLGLDLSDTDNAELDDIIYIDTDENGGIIAGANPRAVLIAVYEYLRKNGCEWLMPGVDGEYIPLKDIKPVKYRHKPSMRHRGSCLEGAVSQQILTGFIDFMPKLGLNCFMVQFKNPYEFYIRHYDHRRNTENRPEELITLSTALQWNRAIECEIARRGIMLHSVGHGWTSDPFGVDSSSGWTDIGDDAIPSEFLDCFAMLNGKRGLFRGRAINSQFCMSNKRARRLFAENIANYLKSHSNVDYLHVWLADDTNNHCECDECNKKRPSDWYMVLMNEVDELLTERKINSRIVFIAYVDTLWSPLEESIKNPDRFTLMMAPISRDYTTTLGEPNPHLALTPYVKNKIIPIRSLQETFLYIDDWRKSWKGQSFSFEYHFWKHHQFDLSGLQIAERLYEDTQAYIERGIDGIMQCGSQRGFFPNGYAYYVHARAQFDAQVPLETLEREYYSVAYGSDWKCFRNLLKKMSDAVPYEYMSLDHASLVRDFGYKKPEMKPRIDSLREISEELLEVVKSHYNYAERVRTVSVRILERYCRYIKLLSVMLSHKSVGEDDEAMAAYEKVRMFLGSTECEFGAYDDNLQKTGFLRQIAQLKAKREIDIANGE